MLQGYIPFLPEGAEPINEHVAVYRHDGEIEFFTASGPIYSCREGDLYGLRLAQGILGTQTRSTPAQIARALNINRTTAYRNIEKYQEGGPSALIIDKKSNRAPYKLKGKTRQKVQKLLDEGYSLKSTASKVGVTEGCIRYAIRNGYIVRINKQDNRDAEINYKTKSASDRSLEDSRCSIGISAKRETERVLASIGEVIEAPVQFDSYEGVRHAGVLLALPVLASIGLLDAGKKVYGSLEKGYYGLQSILLTLAFMAFLRIKTPEQLKKYHPGELGIVLGLDRVPEVKTLRKKLKEMGLRNKAGEFLSCLSHKWSSEDEDVIGYAYIDGHVRPYHGRKHKIPKTHVARRRLCMSATTDFWVNDANCEPLFFVTAESNDSLLSMIENKLIPELKILSGRDRRITLVFDREGWSPKSFEKWFNQGVDIITYRKGKYDPWPSECFFEVESQVRGKPVKYLLGDRSIQVNKGFWLREVRRLCDDGHQTSIITTRQDLHFEEIARRMFFRWNQENFFRYMREEYSLDHLVTNDVENANIERLVPNPEKKEIKKHISNLKKDLVKKRNEYGEKAVKNDEKRRPTMRGFNIANAGLKKEIISLEKEIQKLEKDLKAIPSKITIKDLMAKHEIVRLELERKMITDAIKMICYRAETSLFNLIAPFFNRNNHEGRCFMKTVFQQPADIITDQEQGTLNINFHTMSTPRANQSLKQLCDVMNEESYVYPGTNLTMVFNAPHVANESA